MGSYNQRTSSKCESGAQLTTGHLFWKYVLDGIREAYETINASNQDVFHTAALKVGKNAQPKFSSLLWDTYIPIKSLCPYLLCQEHCRLRALRPPSRYVPYAPSLSNKGKPCLNCSLTEANIELYPSCVIAKFYFYNKMISNYILLFVAVT